jgi:hypothetical protein
MEKSDDLQKSSIVITIGIIYLILSFLGKFEPNVFSFFNAEYRPKLSDFFENPQWKSIIILVALLIFKIGFIYVGGFSLIALIEVLVKRYKIPLALILIVGAIAQLVVTYSQNSEVIFQWQGTDFLGKEYALERVCVACGLIIVGGIMVLFRNEDNEFG